MSRRKRSWSSRPHVHAPSCGMAWLANPFALRRLNTLDCVMPGVGAGSSFHDARRFSARFGVLRGSAFVRLGSGRLALCFRWLLVPSSLCQISPASPWPRICCPAPGASAFGGGVADLLFVIVLFHGPSDSKGEHGGIHEAAIGLGNAPPCGRPVSLTLLPQFQQGAIAVTVLLLCGLGALTQFGEPMIPGRKLQPANFKHQTFKQTTIIR